MALLSAPPSSTPLGVVVQHQPHTEPVLNHGRILRLSAMRYGSHSALEFEGRSTTYRELNDQVNAMAHVLLELGVGTGDRVALIAPNGPDYVRIMFAAAKIGAVAVPTNTGLLAQELAHVFRAAAPHLVVVGDDYSDRVAEALNAAELRGTVRVRRLLPDSAGLAANDHYIGISGFSTDEPPRCDVEDSDTAVLLFTSGSMGAPKAVAKSYANLTWHAINRQISQPRHEGDRELFVLPLSGVGFGNFLLTDILVGATCVLEPRFDPLRAADLLRTGNIQVAFLAPTMLLAIEAATAGIDCPSVTVLETAYEVTHEQRLRIARMVPNAQILYSYGCTEGSMARAEPNVFLHDPTNVGYASGLDEYRALTPDSEIAQIEVSGPTVMRGYLQADGTIDASQIHNGWFPTGDLGRQDEHGAIHFSGRSKDMIKTGGLNVFAAEVESAIADHPLVDRVAVVGVPDDYWGEAVVAVVEIAQGANPQTLDADLRGHARAALAGYKRPKTFLRVDALPINSGGKIAKGEVKAMIETGVAKPLGTATLL